MNRMRFIRTVALPIIVVGAGMPGRPAHGQATGADITRPALEATGARPLIVLDGMELRGGTAEEREAILQALHPAIQSVEVVKGARATERFGEAASGGAILITLKTEFTRPQPVAAAAKQPFVATGRAPLYLVDGVVMSDMASAKIDPNDVQEVEVIRAPAALQLYGERASGGVVSITTRRRTP